MSRKRFRITRTRLFWSIYRMIPDHWVYSLMYFKKFHRRINWKNPIGFNQKINWLKRYYRNPDMVICADKFAVRDFIRNRIGDGYLNELYGVYNSGNDINFTDLPSEFVIKATHGNRMNIICREKADLNIDAVKRTLNSWLNTNFYVTSREWQYCDIPPRIIAEAYINEPDSLKDYRFYCFDGSPKFIRVIYDRSTPTPHEKIYTIDWSAISGTWHFPEKEETIPKPSQLSTMLELVRNLSSGFPFVRVDLYNPDNRILVGELTFHPGNGFLHCQPASLDIEFGGYLSLRKHEATH